MLLYWVLRMSDAVLSCVLPTFPAFCAEDSPDIGPWTTCRPTLLYPQFATPEPVSNYYQHHTSLSASLTSLGLHAHRAKEYHRPGPFLPQPLTQPPIHFPGQLGIPIDTLLSRVGVPIQPFHEREVEACTGVQVLRGVQVQVGECW